MTHIQKYYAKVAILNFAAAACYVGFAAAGLGFGFFYLPVVFLVPLALAFLLWPHVWAAKEIPPEQLRKKQIAAGLIYLGVSAAIVLVHMQAAGSP